METRLFELIKKYEVSLDFEIYLILLNQDILSKFLRHCSYKV